MAASRLSSIVAHFSGASNTKSEHWTRKQNKNWDKVKLPSFDELPCFHEFTGCAWDLWGKGDQLGTVNLLTEGVVQEAAKEVKTGRTVCLNWPVNFPEKPMFTRQIPEIKLIKASPAATWHDDSIHMNTQSGSQWDGIRHCGVHKYGVFYGNTPATDFKGGELGAKDPSSIDKEHIKYGIHNWAQHGICGRGVLLDLVRFFTKNGTQPLPYDPWTSHAFSVADLKACAREQGVEFRRADILLLRVGFTQRYYASSNEDRARISLSETTAGVEQSEDMKRFLWNNHFAAVASDTAALERWPEPKGEQLLHQTLLALWGMPIGEIFDLEKLSEVCASSGRYTFFFTSWPLNVLGGVASPPNAAVSACWLY
ncbi:hypothetical protein M0805_008491 [Coniferiporia weirii]|nr:hypothetical protein M0805_008491 [Coniferiporia weirii]